MLEYDWGGNSSSIILSPAGDEPTTHEENDNNTTPTTTTNQTDLNRHFFHNNINPFTEHGGSHSHLVNIPQPSLSFHHPSTLFQAQHAPHQIHPYFDPRGPYATNSLPLQDHQNQNNYFLIPKTEEMFTTRIGLNLGGRTYFSSAEDDLVNRLYRRSRPVPPLLDPPILAGSRCQAEGCNADLSNAKHYHRRHKVCEFHSKASTVIAHGLTQRFCQQCSRFHLLSEFDNGKRSCRKRLADHNRRRRKSNQANQDNSRNHSPQIQSARNSPSHTLTRSPPDSSGLHSSSSVTVALSPPRMSLDCFNPRPYQATLPATMTTTASNSSASPSSLFY